MEEVIYLLGCMYLEGTEVIPNYGMAICYLTQVTQKYPDTLENLELAKKRKAEISPTIAEWRTENELKLTS